GVKVVFAIRAGQKGAAFVQGTSGYDIPAQFVMWTARRSLAQVLRQFFYLRGYHKRERSAFARGAGDAKRQINGVRNFVLRRAWIDPEFFPADLEIRADHKQVAFLIRHPQSKLVL